MHLQFKPGIGLVKFRLFAEDSKLNPLYRASRGAEALGYPGQSPPARAIPDYLFKDHKPSAIQGKARLRGLWRIISSKTMRCATPPRPCTGAALLRPPYAPLAVGLMEIEK